MSTPLIEGESGVYLTRFGGPTHLAEQVGSRVCYDLIVDRGPRVGPREVSLNKAQAQLVLAALMEEPELDEDRPVTSTEVEAARWIGEARAILERVKVEGFGHHDDVVAVKALLANPWPKQEDWDARIVQ